MTIAYIISDHNRDDGVLNVGRTPMQGVLQHELWMNYRLLVCIVQAHTML